MRATEADFPMNDITDYRPDGPDDVLSQDKSQEQRPRSAVSTDSAIPNQHPLHGETDQYRKPEAVDVEAICNRIGGRVEPPPQESLVHRRQEYHDEKANADSPDG